MVGSSQDAGLPDITGSIVSFENAFSNAEGAFSTSGTNGTANYHNSGKTKMIKYIYFNASSSNALYGASSTIIPESLKCIHFIKF